MGAAWSGLRNSLSTRGRSLFGAACLGVLGSVLLHCCSRWPALAQKEEEARDREEPLQLQIDNTCNFSDVYEVADRTTGGPPLTVVTARKKDTGESVAVKSLKMSTRLTLAREIKIMKCLDHPNIIKLKETYQNGDRVFLVMELGVGGELFDRIIDSGHFSERQAAHCMRQVFRAVEYCHVQNICLRSMRAEDILCMTKGPIEGVVLKLIDASAWRSFTPGVPMTTKTGTPYYVAPQVLAGKYDESCDVWSCGVLLYILLCGYPPFYGETDVEILSKVRLGNYSFNAADWKSISEDAKFLIRMCLKMNPKDRYTSKEACTSQWLKSCFPPKVILTVQTNSLRDGALEVALSRCLSGEEAAKFSYSSNPTSATLCTDAARKLGLFADEIELVMLDGSRWDESFS